MYIYNTYLHNRKNENYIKQIIFLQKQIKKHLYKKTLTSSSHKTSSSLHLTDEDKIYHDIATMNDEHFQYLDITIFRFRIARFINLSKPNFSTHRKILL